MGKPFSALQLLAARKELDIVEGNCFTILAAIMDRRHYQMSVRDLQRLANIRTPNGTHYHLRRLKRLGLVDWQPNSARTIRPLVRFIPASQIP
jgi:SOS-response transcriptional repressor LexA